MKRLILLLSFTTIATVWQGNTLYAQNVWRALNGPSAGIIQASLFFADSSIIIGTERSGIYRTTDGGYTWDSSNTGLPVKDIRSFAADSVGHVYAGTNGAGVFVSIDSGATWQLINKALQGINITALTSDSSGNLFALSDSKILYELTPDRTGWLALHINNIYCIAARKAGGVYVGTTTGTIELYYGNSVVIIESGIFGDTVRMITTDPTNTLYVETKYGVYRSSSSGGGWQMINNSYISAITVRDSELYFVASKIIWRSTDNGANWTEVGFGYPVFDIHIFPNGEIYGATSTSIIFSADQGRTWLNTNPEYIGDFNNCVLAVNPNGHIIVATNNGLFRSTDGGKSWDIIDTGIESIKRNVLIRDSLYPVPKNIILDDEHIAFDQQHLYVGIDGGYTIYRTSDEGVTWKESAGIYGASGISSIAINYKGDIFLGQHSLGSSQIFRSTDSGKSWVFISNSIYDDGAIGALAIDDSNYIYAGNYSLFRSTDNGDTWIDLANVGPSIIGVTSISFDAKGDIYFSGNSGVYVSTDNGITWEDAKSATRLNPFSNTFAVDKYRNTYAAVGNAGIQYLPYGGNLWQTMDSGFPAQPGITSVTIDSDGYLYAGASNGMVYKTISPLTKVNNYSTPPSPSLISAYPNPFTASTHIVLSSSAKNMQRVSITDMLGNEVASFPKGTSGEIDWTPNAALPAGTYFLVARTATGVSSKPIVLLR